MRFLLIIFTVLLIAFAAGSADAQTVTDCPYPSGCVVLSREAALKAIADGDARKALEAESKVKDQAIGDLKDLLHKSQENYAECRGELTTLHQDRVEWMAEKELLFKLVKPKKFGVINF
jgi:hypothetical protein